MNSLSDKQKQKLLAMAEIADKGDLAVVTQMFEMQDTFETATESLKETAVSIEATQQECMQGMDALQSEISRVEEIKQNVQKGDKGDPGSDGKDGRDGKDGVGKPGRDGRDGRDGTDGRDGLDGKDGTDGSPDTPDQVVAKVNESQIFIRKDRIEGMADLERIARANAEASSLPQTTSFINGRRAKNINFSGASVAYRDDTATVTITGGSGGHTIQDEGTPLTARTNLNFVGAGVTATDDAANDATVITISGSAANFADNEVVSGSGTSFTLANTPVVGSVKVFGAGTRLKPGAGNDYTISGTGITIINGTYLAGEIVADYRY